MLGGALPYCTRFARKALSFPTCFARRHPTLRNFSFAFLLLLAAPAIAVAASSSLRSGAYSLCSGTYSLHSERPNPTILVSLGRTLSYPTLSVCQFESFLWAVCFFYDDAGRLRGWDVNLWSRRLHTSISQNRAYITGTLLNKSGSAPWYAHILPTPTI